MVGASPKVGPGRQGNRGDVRDDERDLWLPPHRLRRYQWQKVLAALTVLVIFVGWMVLRWQSTTVRITTGGLMVITIWVLVRSIVSDVGRGRGRQVTVQDGVMRVTTPGGDTDVALDKVQQAEWQNGSADAYGLSLYDGAGHTLVHLDASLLADEAEARVFLNWVRQRADVKFEVRWPAVGD